ncbi:MAG: TIGR00341 family protein [Flavobacteriales bacterium]|nr:TIGR00341 family protein [Flavobacteriales bacterium]MCB0788750.1 TIGR00341 family protein [Flavobacteriales bacterium]MCB0813383.1 TIGR00341 family protein [Flavobacteriales bacterium]HPF68758.1 TIGR00341 family protein [Flavobacteriales bacterium]
MSTLRQFINPLAVRRLFDLTEDAQEYSAVVEEVSRNVVFRGTNLWILMFAIVICSVGLNVNSTAVIIGAMLISPLMGPIIGVGVGVGIFDTQLIRKGARNLLVAVVISVFSSALYFWITPLSEAQSELLARTTPTLWDVLIALFGGLAGIVAATRKEKTNVIPGVAIATALMPPLCTTGYGLATGQWAYFLGALYLFFINAVFISVSAFLLVRLLRFPRATFVDQVQERRVRWIVWTVVVITVIPSIWLAYTLVERTLFQRRAELFVTQEFDFPETRVVEKRIDPRQEQRSIEVFLLGEPLEDELIERIQSHMARYGLNNAHLVVNQGRTSAQQIDVNALRSGILEELYKQNQQALLSKDARISELEGQLQRVKATELPVKDILDELRAQHPKVRDFTLNRNVLYHVDNGTPDTALVAIARFKGKVRQEEMDRMKAWLKARTRMDSVIVLVQ